MYVIFSHFRSRVAFLIFNCLSLDVALLQIIAVEMLRKWNFIIFFKSLIFQVFQQKLLDSEIDNIVIESSKDPWDKIVAIWKSHTMHVSARKMHWDFLFWDVDSIFKFTSNCVLQIRQICQRAVELWFN
jgi:hypothetical protein